ncbi:TonB-dependent receptor [Maribacter cobaltidurans]|uniref:TonB-dependent receptor n=1 Tax=Maribacter cobaltidurans TaxID=1178778 RepID=A0A223V4V0_9FLAO|nr:TonB-dependent receptor [Maribacter cobaltidurans]ASV30421.1 TonB-dependent receptor [Maribacter cobaltidurans]GGD78502.1 TonB-dependent receptor [Maribacter cobaltidurans]
MKKIYFAIAAFLLTATVFSQTTITGTVVDGEMGGPLPGATVVVKGTSNGTSTDFDGNFTIESATSSGTLRVSYIGFMPQEVSFTGGSVGTISLMPNAEELEGVVVTGVQDIAKDRKTPVAVSTIKAEEIQLKLGSQEFPEILNTTPSIYATKSGGGFGDARVNIRGFDTNNSAVMINGVPVNDMENGQVYWSNWAGLSDVTSAIQVQRGLGSSKLAVSSVGGTINVITKTSLNAEGGAIGATVGNDGYVKTLASYSSGLLDNGFSASLLLSRTGGSMYADGTKFEGYNFFLGLGYTKGDHNLEFMVTGAPQWHHQRDFAPSIADYIRYGGTADKPNRKYNSDWGYRNGEEYSFRRNFYHKPVISLNWSWAISDKTTLETSAYASFGRGGGTGEIGEINGTRQFALPKSADGLVRVDDIIAYNSGTLVPDFSDTPREQINGLYLNNSDQNPNENNTNGITRRASVNSHNWYGLLANFNNRISEDLTIDFGLDLRKYTGYHYRRVNDLLGGDAYQETDNDNDPNQIFRETYKANQPWWVFGNIDDEEKIDYYNTGLVNWLGVFGQVEYNFTPDVTAFVQGALSNQGFAREEFFSETPPEKTDYENILGGNVKGGVNWNIDAHNNVFANAGYYSKQPLFDAVYLNFGNNLNPNLTNEKITGFELGYGYRSSKFRGNVNLYSTSWKDRFASASATFNAGQPDEIRGTANLLGIKQVHTGIEMDGRFQASDKFALTGMISIGNWEYKDDVNATYFDNDQNPIVIGGVEQQETLELDGIKVGDAAQFTAFIGANYNIIENLSVDLGYRYADNLYAQFDATDVGPEGSLKLPSFGLMDAGTTFNIPFDDKMLSFRLNVNNVFDTTYIAESDTNIFAQPGDETYDGINTRNRVFFGFGTTWNLSARFNF